MPDLAPIDRLQPCLLDRLCDDEPGKQVESRSQRVISMQRYREGVLRDLRWLFNTPAHLETEEIAEFPEVRQSVLNFGVRDLSGLVAESLDLVSLEHHVKQRIICFEPRLRPETLRIRIATGAEDAASHLTLKFEISGELWAQPMPERFFARTEVDLETGQCQILG